MGDLLEAFPSSLLILTFGSPAKPSIPSRAYLHLTKEDYLSLLSDKIRNVTFLDSKGVPKEPAVPGPPTVEFAPYGRIPNGRGRKDLRQGTIDQDQEFINFLESLTNPIVKPSAVDQSNDTAGKNKEKVTVTPLVQFLKDKKANKGKEPSPPSKTTKHARQDSSESANGPSLDKRPSSKASNNFSISPEKPIVQAIKIEKATREVVQVIKQQAAEVSKTSLPVPANPAVEKTPIVAKNILVIEKRRERGSASAAAKILQRDLGFSSPRGGGGRRGGSRAAPKPVSSSPTAILPKDDSSSSTALKESGASAPHATSSKETPSSVGTSTLTPKSPESSSGTQPPKGPAASRAGPKTSPVSEAKSPPPNAGKKVIKDAPVSPTATQAFLKHANPSQGITETLLEEAFAGFGIVKKVEIDKKKGFGYVDFTEPKGLQEAIKASPIKVAQGQVVVLERKMGPTLQARNVRGGATIGNRGGSPIGSRAGRGGVSRRGGGRGGGNNPNSSLPQGQAVPPAANQTKTTEASQVSLATNPQSVPDIGPNSTTSATPTTSDNPQPPDS